MEDSKLQILYFSKNFLYEEIIWQAKIYGGGANDPPTVAWRH